MQLFEKVARNRAGGDRRALLPQRAPVSGGDTFVRLMALEFPYTGFHLFLTLQQVCCSPLPCQISVQSLGSSR